MKRSIFISMTLLFLAISTLSGCLLVPVDEGNYRGSRGHGDYHGDRYEDRHDNRGDRY